MLSRTPGSGGADDPHQTDPYPGLSKRTALKRMKAASSP
jgi:hypothetical protein